MKRKREQHGLCKKSGQAPEYMIWTAMKQRCNNPHHRSFKNYGGRGVVVCREWASSFTQFLKDMGLRPSEKHTLDRINVDGPYSPQNCRWATASQQGFNRRKAPQATSKYIGVSKRYGKWRAQICVNYRQITIGVFETEESAHKAYMKAKEVYEAATQGGVQ